MLATDLDGTLVGPDGTISPRCVRAIFSLREAGWTVTPATGRPPRWLAPVAAQIGWLGFAVAANGAVVVDLEKQVVQRTFPIPESALLQTIHTVRALVPTVSFAFEHVEVGASIPGAPGGIPQQWVRRIGQSAVFSCEPGFDPPYRLPAGTPIARAESLVSLGNVVKLLARLPRSRCSDEWLSMLEVELHELVSVTHSIASEVVLEISARGVSKALGLAHVAVTQGVDQRQVVAVGDMPNDLPMLSWAGQGWAMANAHPAVLAAVGPTRVLPSNRADGVAHLIGGLMLGDLRRSLPLSQ